MNPELTVTKEITPVIDSELTVAKKITPVIERSNVSTRKIKRLAKLEKAKLEKVKLEKAKLEKAKRYNKAKRKALAKNVEKGDAIKTEEGNQIKTEEGNPIKTEEGNQIKTEETILREKIDSMKITKPLYELTPNEQIINQYIEYTKQNPNLLPSTPVFGIIDDIYKNELIPIINKDPKNGKEEDKHTFLKQFFSNTEDLMKDLEEETITKPIDITLKSYTESKLYYFITKLLWYGSERGIFKDGKLNIDQVKYQVFKDIHRISEIRINDVILNSGTSPVIQPFTSDYYAGTDYFNLYLMNLIDKAGLPIDSNIINLIDIFCIQYIIGQCDAAVLYNIVKKGILQGGPGERFLKYNIVLNTQDQYIICHNKTPLVIMDMEPRLGKYESVLKIDLQNLEYSFKVFIDPPPPELLTSSTRQMIESEDSTSQTQTQKITNKMANMGKGAIDYAKTNPGTVASVAGTSLVVGAAAATVLAMGLLGGKTKKYLYKKYPKRKTIRKKKKRVTRKNKNKRNKSKTNKK